MKVQYYDRQADVKATVFTTRSGGDHHRHMVVLWNEDRVQPGQQCDGIMMVPPDLIANKYQYETNEIEHRFTEMTISCIQEGPYRYYIDYEGERYWDSEDICHLDGSGLMMDDDSDRDYWTVPLRWARIGEAIGSWWTSKILLYTGYDRLVDEYEG